MWSQLITDWSKFVTKCYFSKPSQNERITWWIDSVTNHHTLLQIAPFGIEDLKPTQTKLKLQETGKGELENYTPKQRPLAGSKTSVLESCRNQSVIDFGGGGGVFYN
jgi:hypothetical protein